MGIKSNLLREQKVAQRGKQHHLQDGLDGQTVLCIMIKEKTSASKHTHTLKKKIHYSKSLKVLKDAQPGLELH